MSLTIDLPPVLDTELTEDAQREGVSVTDHATLLLYLVNAFADEETLTPFKQAVRVFLSYNSIDADRLAAVLDQLRAICLNDDDRHATKLNDTDRLMSILPQLRAWRNAAVHGTVLDNGVDAVLSGPNGASSAIQAKAGSEPQAEPVRKPDSELVSRVRRLRGKYTRLGVSTEELHEERQKDKNREEHQARGDEQ